MKFFGPTCTDPDSHPPSTLSKLLYCTTTCLAWHLVGLCTNPSILFARTLETTDGRLQDRMESNPVLQPQLWLIPPKVHPTLKPCLALQARVPSFELLQWDWVSLKNDQYDRFAASTILGSYLGLVQSRTMLDNILQNHYSNTKDLNPVLDQCYRIPFTLDWYWIDSISNDTVIDQHSGTDQA